MIAALPGPTWSPDGMDMLSLAADARFDPAHWSVLWPLLVSAVATLLSWELAAWVVGALSAALCVVPIRRFAAVLGGPLAGSLAVGWWCLLPAVRAHAAVLDARPLSWLLVAWTLALGAEAREGGRGWGRAFFPAALAPLVRPEGLCLVPVLATLAVLHGAPVRPILGKAALALAPVICIRLAFPTADARWMHLWSSWSTIWTPMDFVALHGVGSGATPYRQFVLAALDAGIERTPAAGSLDTNGTLERARWLVQGLGEAFGMGIPLTAALSAWPFRPAPVRRLASIALIVAPLALLAGIPRAWGQATLAATVLWTGPLWLGAAAAVVARVGRGLSRRARRQRFDALLVLAAFCAVAAEAAVGRPGRRPTPFIEDGDAQRIASAWMAVHREELSSVHCTVTGRGAVQRAGLVPWALPTRWEAWSPQPGDHVLLTSADLGGQDGGRGLEVLRSGEWTLDHLAHAPNTSPESDPAWMAILTWTPSAGGTAPTGATGR